MPEFDTPQFVESIPKVKGRGVGAPRASKYDALYAMLKENPGRWALVGSGKNLHGALTAYRKRRNLSPEEFSIAWREGHIYAGVGVTLSGEDESAPKAEPDADEAADTPADEADDEGDEGAEGEPDSEPDAAATFPVSTGVESPVTAGTSDDSWA